MMQGDALLVERMVYGNRALYASKHSPLAQRMAEIQRRLTFDNVSIERWRGLGFTFTIQRLPE